MYKLRLIYTKKEDIRFISHLDLIRTLNRALRRSGLLVSLTQGFNPHFNISFSVSLPLGIESYAESADIIFEGFCGEITEIKLKLNKVMPYGMEILEVFKLEEGDVPINKLFGKYLFEADFENVSNLECVSMIKSWKDKDCFIEVMRNDIKKVINIKERVDDIYIEEKNEQSWMFMFLLKSNESGAILSPFLFLKTFLNLKNSEELNIKIRKKCFIFEGGVYGR